MVSKINISNNGSGCFSQDTLIKYLHGELTGMEMNRVERHLDTCPMCADELEGLSLLEPPEDIRGIAEKLSKKIDGRISATQKKSFNIPYYLKIAATLLVLVSVSSLVYYSIKQITPSLTITEHVAFEEETALPKATKQKEILTQELQERDKIVIIQSDERRATTTSPVEKIEIGSIVEDVVDFEVDTILSFTEIDDDTISKGMFETVSTPLPAAAGAPVIDATSNNESREKVSETAVTSLGRSKRRTKAETASTSTYDRDIEVVEANWLLDEEEIDEEQIFLVVEQMPVFENGDDDEDFRTYIAKNINYPRDAEKNGIQGKVFVEFTIEVNGSVSDVRIIKSVDPLLDKEAVRVIESSPAWNPGMQRGRPVRVKMTFPVNFEIK